jgi:hypothetical protein
MTWLKKQHENSVAPGGHSNAVGPEIRRVGPLAAVIA